MSLVARKYTVVSGVETPTQPDAGTPSADSDVITKGYADANFGESENITGSIASPSSITAGGGITPVAGKRKQIIFVKGTGGVDITANPQIAAGTIVGQRLLLIGTSDTDTLKLDHGTGLDLNGSITLGLRWQLSLLWDGNFWMEVSRAER